MSKVMENRVMAMVREDAWSQTVTDLAGCLAQAHTRNVTDASIERYAFTILELLDKGELVYGTYGVVELP
jgi:hypothetical protein